MSLGALTDTETRRFREWYTEFACRAGELSPNFSGHRRRLHDGRTDWLYHDTEIQAYWRGWQAALTFRTLGNL